jgi:PAS domain S-box-containing protein
VELEKVDISNLLNGSSAVADDESSLLRLRLTKMEQEVARLQEENTNLLLNHPKNFQLQVLSQIADAVVMVDQERNVTYWNRGAENLYEYSADYAIGKSLYDLYDIEWINAEDEELCKQAVATYDQWSGEVIHVVKSTKRRHFIAITSSVVRNNDSEPAGFLAIIRDITERKRAAEQQKFLADATFAMNSELEIQPMLNKVLSLVVPPIADTCTVHLLSGEQLELAATHAYSTEHEKLLEPVRASYSSLVEESQGVGKVIRTGQTDYNFKIDEQTLLKNYQNNAITEVIRNAGYLSYIVAPLYTRGRVIGAIAFTTTKASGRYLDKLDVPFLEALAARLALTLDNLRLYEQIQLALTTQRELDYLKDLFISIASHELRTPLTAIKGFAELLERNMLKPSQPRAEKLSAAEIEDLRARPLRNVRNILKQSERMNNLIRQMHDFSRLHNSKFTLQTSENSDLLALVERVVEQFQLTTPDRKLILERNAELDKLFASFDESRIEQVLTNLISNALKYSPPPAPVKVKISRVENEIVIAVRDEGQGIHADDQQHIFERFYRVQRNDVERVEGLGLGLYISHEIIVQHGGRMWLESEPGKGSTFFIALSCQPS